MSYTINQALINIFRKKNKKIERIISLKKIS